MGACSFEYGSYGYIAQKDMEVATDNILNHPNTAAVYAQQAVEKMLKQYLIEVLHNYNENLLKTHNLRVLSRASGIDSLDVTILWDLSDAYKFTTYPNHEYSELSIDESRKLCEGASAIIVLIEAEVVRFRAHTTN